jgi:hypothetical protein
MSADRSALSTRLQSLGIIALAGFVFYRASRMSNFGSDPGSPGVFPAVIALVLLVCALLIWRESTSGRSAQAFDIERVTSVGLIAAVMAVLYGAVLRPLGFAAASFLYLAASFLWLRATTWWKGVLLAIATVAVTFVVFRHVFLVILP